MSLEFTKASALKEKMLAVRKPQVFYSVKYKLFKTMDRVQSSGLQMSLKVIGFSIESILFSCSEDEVA